jgi:hypothetical protein
MSMSIQDEWTRRFKDVVDSEISKANGREADGYRAVAEKTGLGYDYIYQIYKGKPAKKDAISKAYPEFAGALVARAPQAAPALSHNARQLGRWFDRLPESDEKAQILFEVMELINQRKRQYWPNLERLAAPQEETACAQSIALPAHEKTEPLPGTDPLER